MIKEILKQKWYLLFILLFMILDPTINSVLNFWLQKIFNSAVPGASKTLVIKLLAIGFLLWILRRTISFVSNVLTSRITCNIKYEVKHKMFVKIFKLDTANIVNKGGSGDYISLFTNDITILETRFFNQIVNVFSGIFSILILGGSFLALNWKLGLSIIGFGIITTIIPLFFSQKINLKQLEYSDSISSLTQSIKEYTIAYPTIKNYSIENSIIRRFNFTNKQTENKKFEVDYSLSIANNVGIILSWFMQFIAVGLGIILVIKGEIFIGTVISAQSFASDLAYPLQGLIVNINSIKSVKEIIKKIDSFSENTDNHETVLIEEKVDSLKGSGFEIEYKNVSLTLDDNIIIDDFSFKFKEGKKYLVIGLNGAGKSTLFKILKKWHAGIDGEVLIGGNDICNLSNELISKKVSYLNENVSVFSGTVKENITLFRQHSEDDFMNALEASQIKIDLDRVIVDEGRNISSGEQRRIEIARSLLDSVNVLILDEVVSTLDIETAFEIEKMALGYDDKTVIFISHNFSGKLIKSYDEILVIQNGKLLSHGNYDYLINNCEYFKKICDIKFYS